MRNIIIILAVALMLLTVGCKPQADTGNGLVKMPDVSKEDAQQAIEENAWSVTEPEAEELSNLPAETPASLEDFKFTQGQSMAYGENKVLVKSIGAGPLVDVVVDGVAGRLIETKSEEVINGLIISIKEFKFKLKDSPENYAVLNIKPLELADDEYLMFKDDQVSVGGKKVRMVEPRADGSVIVEVMPSFSGNERIIAGSSKIIDNLEISPVKVFTKDRTRKAYAIIQVVGQ